MSITGITILQVAEIQNVDVVFLRLFIMFH